MRYVEPVYRPPSEAMSLLIQATVGCSAASAGHCYFCGSWLFAKTMPEKKFRIRPMEEILEDLQAARSYYGAHIRKVFFLDSNALAMKTVRLAEITREAYRLFDGLERVSVYACARDILRKSRDELEGLREAGLKLLYLGLESGNDRVLDLHSKGVDSGRTVEACNRAQEAGLDLSVTVILGLGGLELSVGHAVDTGRVISRINPRYMGALTLMVVPGTPVHDWIEKGEFEIPDQAGILEELETMIENIEVKREMVFRTNHASNYLPLKGTLPGDKAHMLELIGRAKSGRIALRSEKMRGL